MTWKDLFLGRRKARNAWTHPADELMESLTRDLSQDDLLPSSDPAEDYYVLVHEHRYPALTWDELLPHPLLPDDHEHGEPPLPFSPNQAETALRLRLSHQDVGVELVDFYRANTPVVSQAVRDILEPLTLPGVEFFPTVIRMAGIPDARAYITSHYALYLEHEIDCLDESRCEYQHSGNDDLSRPIRLVLDSDRLTQLDVRQRLLFKPLGGYEYLLHHQLVRRLQACGLRGAQFVPVREWQLNLDAN